jgi:hypothetical protein
MTDFPAPYRIVRVCELLKARPELEHCDIVIEALPVDNDERCFPTIQFDTSRVFVRYK